MSGRTFVDTNILVYAHDKDSGAKHKIAKEVVEKLWDERTGVLSLQVLQEFYVTVTRKIATPLSKDLARAVVSSYEMWCMQTTPAEISVAFRIEGESKIGFWGAMIISSASASGATRLLTEDLNAGQRIGGVLIEDPFSGIQ